MFQRAFACHVSDMPIVSYVSDTSKPTVISCCLKLPNGMPNLAILCERRMHNPGFTLTFDSVRPGTGDLTRIQSTLFKLRAYPAPKYGRSPVIFTRRMHPQMLK